MKKSILCLCLIAMNFVAWAQKNIKLNLEIGKTYVQKHYMDTEMTTEVMGMNVPMKMKVTEHISFKPTHLENGVYTMEANYEVLKTDMEVNGNNISMGSDGDASNPMNSIFVNLMHKPFEVKIQENGELLEINGIKEILEKVLEAAEMPEMMKGQMKASLEKSVSKDAFSNSFSFGGLIYPGKEVTVGDTWKREFALESQAMKVDYLGSYQLKEINSDYAVIQVNSVSDAAKSSIAAAITGEVKIDMKTGWLISANGNNSLNGKTQMDNPMDPSAEKMDVTLDVKSTVNNTGEVL